MKKINWSRQIQDLSINREKLESDFLDGVDLNITDGNNNATITWLSAGTLDNDAVNMSQFNMALNGLKQKFYARAADIATNVTLSWPQTVDGVACVDGDQVLLWGQTTATEDGLYIVRAGAWERAAYREVGDAVWPYLVAVQEWTNFDNCGLIVTNDKGSDIVGTDNLVFIQSYWPGAVGASNGLSMRGNDVILGWDMDQDTYIYMHNRRFDLSGGKINLEATGWNRIDMNMFSGHTGIRIRNSGGTIGISVLDQDLPNGVQLRTASDLSQLTNHPTGTVPLAIATVDYVDNASSQPIKESHTLTAGEITAGSFTVSQTVLANSMDFVFNGNVEDEGDEYTVSGTTVTLVTPADWVAGDVIKLKYRY